MERIDVVYLLERIADALDEKERQDQQRHEELMDALQDIASTVGNVEHECSMIGLNTA